MPFVQSAGGRLNASTRERHTDFFFQLPTDQLEEGVLRLLDMLANPLLDSDSQLRERQVLHAEFHARAQDAETLCDAALGQITDPANPFSGFHAGNRDTLPVEEAAFQQALLGYHRRFYHAGQIELLLAGPQQSSMLRGLAHRVDAGLAAGPFQVRKAPPLCWTRNDWLRLQLARSEPRLHVAFVLSDLPDDAAAALDYLSVWLASEAPGGLVQRLRDAELCQSVGLRIPYLFAGQGVAIIELLPTAQGLDARALLIGAVLDWLRFFADDARWQPCREEFRRIRRRALQNAEPLSRLRYWVDLHAWSPESDEAAIQKALSSIAAQMLGSAPLVLIADNKDCPPIETNGFPLRMQFEMPLERETVGWTWTQPTPNPWLASNALRYEATHIPSSLRWHGAAAPSEQGALFVQWQFLHGQPTPAMWHTLAHASKSAAWAAEQAGVTLRFEDIGDAWGLALLGFTEAIPAVLADLMQIFAEPQSAAFAEGEILARRDASLSGDQILIRQLLRRLPRLLADWPAMDGIVDVPDRAALSQVWNSSQWHGLALGFEQSLSGPLIEATAALPGVPAAMSLAVGKGRTGKRWHEVGGGVAKAETALLLFCHLPEHTVDCEAAWRVLARMIEPDFFQRLRSELQLGYAVFSRFCQFGAHAGILFGVQSPTASAKEILDHVETFLAAIAVKMAEQPGDVFQRAAKQASDRHVVSGADIRAYAEQAWQSLQAGHELDRPTQVAAAMRKLQRQNLTAALDTLRAASDGWVVVSNAPAPDMTWI